MTAAPRIADLAVQTEMDAAVVHAPNVIRVDRIPRPEPRQGEVLVHIMVTGICGSDLPRVLGDGARSYPLVLGHEFSGVVAEIGEGVTRVAVGDRVAGIPLMPCGDCLDCANGHFSQCASYSFIGSRANGSWAEYVAIPQENVLPVGDRVSFEDAAMIEPSSVALHAFRLAGFTGGGRVAVIGAGNIGQLTAQWARLLGATHITVFDVDQQRLDTVRALGAHQTLRPGDDAWQDATGGRGFDLVIETAGVPVAVSHALSLVAKKGSIVLVGTSTRDVTLTPAVLEQLNRREARIVGSWMSYSAPFPGAEWTDTLRELRQGRLVFEELVAARLPLSKVGDAFDLFRADEPVRGKVLLYNEEYLRARDEGAE